MEFSLVGCSDVLLEFVELTLCSVVANVVEALLGSMSVVSGGLLVR